MRRPFQNKFYNMHLSNVIATFQRRPKLFSLFFHFLKIIVELCAFWFYIFDKNILIVLKSKRFSCFYAQKSPAIFYFFFFVVWLNPFSMFCILLLSNSAELLSWYLAGPQATHGSWWMIAFLSFGLVWFLSPFFHIFSAYFLSQLMSFLAFTLPFIFPPTYWRERDGGSEKVPPQCSAAY